MKMLSVSPKQYQEQKQSTQVIVEREINLFGLFWWHTAMYRAYSWLWADEILLAVPGDHIGCQGSNQE